MRRFFGRPDERGSAAVFGVAFTGLLVSACLIGCAIAALLVGQRRAAAGADLAALAGAAALQHGQRGCAEAAHTAGANNVRLVRCQSEGDVVTVEVATDVTSALGRAWTVGARARAGPER